MDHSILSLRIVIASALVLGAAYLSNSSLCGDEPVALDEAKQQVPEYWLTVAARHEEKFGVYSFGITGDKGQRLVVGDKPLGEPSWSPDGSHLAFVSFDEGPGQICVLNTRTQKVARLTNSKDWERNPMWSPDGNKLAFTSRRDNGSEEIYVMDADGRNQINLTKAEGADADPTWSPDGKQIAFASQRGKGAFRLFVMNADGSEPHPLSDREFTGWLFPDWSPDGKWIAVGEFTNQGNVDLLLFNLQDKTFRTVVGQNGCNTFARWSPDGRYIAFAHFQSPPFSYRAGDPVESLALGNLMLYDGDSAAVTTLGTSLVPGWGPRPCWQRKE